MMRHHQHRRQARPHRRSHRRFHLRTDVAGQQHPPAASLHQQHAGAVVVAVAAAGRRAQHAEAHAIPLPRLSGRALLHGQAHAGGFAGQPACLRKRLCNRLRATGVIIVAMADHQRIHARQAQRMDGRQHHGLAEVETGGIARTGVIDQQVIVRAHQHRQPLPHVEHPQPERSVGRRTARRQQQRQEQHRPEPAQRHPARHEHPQRTDHRQQQRVELHRRQIPVRPRPGGHALEQPPLRVDDPRGQPQHRRGQRRAQQQQQHPEQRARHDHETHHRHRDQVGQRTDQRRLAEEPQGQRQQRHGHQQLAGGEFVQEGTPTAALRLQAENQERHADEGQPESRRQHRQRIGQQDRDHRQRQRLRPAAAAPTATRQRHHRDHQQRTHGRQAEAGQRAVDHGEQQCRGGLRLRPRQTQRRWRPPRVDQPGQPHAEHRRHADVETGDRDQVRDAVRPCHRPVLLVEATRVADREGAQQRGIVRVMHARGDAAGDRRARAVHAPARTREAAIAFILAYVAGGDDAALQRRALAVGAAGVEQRARALQTQQQAPTRARRERRRALVPRHGEQAVQGQRPAVQLGAFDPQGEAAGIGTRQRQSVETADDEHVAAFQRARQPGLHRLRAAPQRPGDTQRQGAQPAPARTTPRPGQRQHDERQADPHRRQARPRLHQQHACQQGQRHRDRPVSRHAASPVPSWRPSSLACKRRR